MPSYITHRYFGERVVQEFDGFSGVDDIINHHTAFMWGVQGPDLLFYLPDNGNPLFGSIGGLMHRARTDRLFTAISRLLIEKKDLPIFPALASYVYGFICHYCLDRNMHEYVYCAVESLKEHYRTSSPFGVHIKLETDMDTAFYRAFEGRNIRHFKLEEDLLAPGMDLDAVALFHSIIVSEVYDLPLPAEYIPGCIERYFAREKMSFDPSGIISWTRLRWKELKAGEYHTHTTNWRPSVVRNDVLNTEHREWRNLWYPCVARNESLLEIFERSVEDACRLILMMEQHTAKKVPFRQKNMVSFDNGNPKYYPNFENESEESVV